MNCPMSPWAVPVLLGFFQVSLFLSNTAQLTWHEELTFACLENVVRNSGELSIWQGPLFTLHNPPQQLITGCKSQPTVWVLV